MTWLRFPWRSVVIPLVNNPLHRQRIKLLWYAWGYIPLIFIPICSLGNRMNMIVRFIRIDWNVLHAHLPSEIVWICRAISEQQGTSEDVMVEAGCWKGGSSAKFSILCNLVGIRLLIYDSFEGVSVADAKNEWEGFAGQYASPENVLWDHLTLYGEPSVCSVFKGWFSETLARKSVPYPIRLAYIDCDLAKGTLEAMMGIVPSLKPKAAIFTQDFHIDPVRMMLFDPSTWGKLGQGKPEITQLGEYLARITLS